MTKVTNISHNIEISCDNDEGEQFAEWLIAQGHTAKVGSSTGDYIDGVWTSHDNDASETMNALWSQYCNSPEPTNNRDKLALYLVSEGDVTPAEPDAEWDGTNSILVAATSADAALTVADAYDSGKAAADNLVWDGATIAVVTLRDRDTGLYA